MKQWTKLRRDIIKSERMATLLESSPLAYALYMNAKAVCDDYGRIEASPRKFKGLVAPLSGIPIDAVAKAIEAMGNVFAEDGMPLVNLYSVDGDRYMEIVGYNDVEETDWRNVSKPSFPEPDDWTPPKSLLTFFIRYAPRDSRVTLERYGLRVTHFPEDQREIVKAIIEHCKTQKSHNPKQSSARPSPDARPVVGRQTPDARPSIGLALDVDVDVDNTSERLLSEIASGALDDVDLEKCVAHAEEEKKRLKLEKTQQDNERVLHQQQRLDILLEGFSPQDRKYFDAMIAGQQEKRGGRPLTRLMLLEEAEIYQRELAEHGSECWQGCCAISFRQGVCSMAYARGCVESWKTSHAGGNGVGLFCPRERKCVDRRRGGAGD